VKVSEVVLRDDLDADWARREAIWRRKLGRIRLGVEPIAEQLARYRRVTWVLTAIPVLMGCFIGVLFAVFGRPGVGMVLVAVLLLPIVLGAWLDHAFLVSRATRYLREHAEYLHERAKCSPPLSESRTAPEPG
jgi:fatty acid desaturase